MGAIFISGISRNSVRRVPAVCRKMYLSVKVRGHHGQRSLPPTGRVKPDRQHTVGRNSAFCTLHSAFKKHRRSGAFSLSKKYFRQADQAGEKVTRWPFLHPEGVRWYSERVKKGQNDAKIVGIRCPDDFSKLFLCK